MTKICLGTKEQPCRSEADILKVLKSNEIENGIVYVDSVLTLTNGTWKKISDKDIHLRVLKG